MIISDHFCSGQYMGQGSDPRNLYESHEDMRIHQLFLKFGLSISQCNEILETLKMVIYVQKWCEMNSFDPYWIEVLILIHCYELVQDFNPGNLSTTNVNVLHDRLLRFSDGCGIEEKDLHLPCDGKQRVKLFWRNIAEIVFQWLQDTELKEFIVYEATIERWKLWMLKSGHFWSCLNRSVHKYFCTELTISDHLHAEFLLQLA